MNKRMAPPASGAVNVREIVSPGGVKAWLVEDYAVPIVSLELAFRGGATQDPALQDGGDDDLFGAARRGRRRSRQPGVPSRARREGDRDRLPRRPRQGRRAHADAQQASRPRRRVAGDWRSTRPRFDEEPFERVREQVKAHLRHEMNDPGTVAWRGFRARVFTGHPYEQSERRLRRNARRAAPPRYGGAAWPADRARRAACGGRRRNRRRAGGAAASTKRFRRSAGEGAACACRPGAVPGAWRRRGDRPRRPADDDPFRSTGAGTRRTRDYILGVRARPYSRRRHGAVVATVPRGAREARARLHCLRRPLDAGPCELSHRRHHDQERARARNRST